MFKKEHGKICCPENCRPIEKNTELNEKVEIKYVGETIEGQ